MMVKYISMEISIFNFRTLRQFKTNWELHHSKIILYFQPQSHFSESSFLHLIVVYKYPNFGNFAEITNKT